MRLSAAFVLSLGAMLSTTVAHAQDCDDEALSEAAFALMAEPGVPSTARLESAARESGSSAVALRLVRSDPGAAELAALLTSARASDGSLVRCGEAEADGDVLRIVGREAARLRVSLVDAGLAVDVTPFAALASLTRPTLVVRAVEGTSFRRELNARDTRVPLPDGFPEAFVAQIVATDASGPRPVAETVFGIAISPETSAATNEELAPHVARLRHLVGAPQLRANHVLDEVAVAHAAAVCATGRAVHELEGLGPVERLRRAGVEARGVGEVVARASSRSEALTSFDASPSHRLALEDAHYTDAGFGEATTADGHVCAVVVLAAWPRFAGR